MLPMVDPNDLVISGWDISGLNLKDAMERAKVCVYVWVLLIMVVLHAACMQLPTGLSCIDFVDFELFLIDWIPRIVSCLLCSV